MVTRKISIIANPASAGGKTGKKLHKIIKLIDKYFSYRYKLNLTSRPRDATNLSRKAAKEDFDTIIVIGGDGTIQEIVNGFYEHDKLINPHIKLGIINCGTGCGLSQSLNLPCKTEEQLQIIYQGYTSSIDIGKAIYNNGEIRPETRYFVNELQLGIGSTVVNKVQTKQKKLGGFLAFGLTAALTIFSQKDHEMTLAIDSQLRFNRKFLGIVIANGAYTGGGMNLAPQAQLNDGYFDILLIHAQSIPQRLKNFPRIYFGKHINLSQFSYGRARKIKIDSSDNILLEADGELLGHLPCSVEILPAAIRIFTQYNQLYPVPNTIGRDKVNDIKKRYNYEKPVQENIFD
jgi:diacylglycerol kinase (ATP)